MHVREINTVAVHAHTRMNFPPQRNESWLQHRAERKQVFVPRVVIILRDRAKTILMNIEPELMVKRQLIFPRSKNNLYIYAE